jgi:glycosyltransferase involved in cell wall biosynthesis
MLKVAFILPSLAQKGPIIVAKDCIDQLRERIAFEVYYFDNIVELDFNCPIHKITFSDDIDFEKYDIIHSHMYRPDKYIWKNRKKIAGKTITTIHCDIRKDLMFTYNIIVSLIFRWLWLLFIRSHDKVVVLTNHIMNTYYRHYISKNKLICIYNGRPNFCMDTVNYFDRLLIEKIKKAGFKIIGTNASLTKRKGLHHVIKILPYISDFVFIVVGDGSEMEYLKKIALRLDVDDRCYFLGSREDARSYLAYYDVYAMPSMSEGFSLALIEATLFKKSCVCSDIEIMREIFNSHEVTFCKPHNKSSLREAIIEAYSKKDEKGQRAYERSSRYYTSKIMGQCYFDLYNSLQRMDNTGTGLDGHFQSVHNHL